MKLISEPNQASAGLMCRDRVGGMIRVGFKFNRQQLLREARLVRENIFRLGPICTLTGITLVLSCSISYAIAQIDRQRNGDPPNVVLSRNVSNAVDARVPGSAAASLVNQWASTALAHPLFEPDSPATAAGIETVAAVAIEPPAPPSLTGIITGPGGNVGIFSHNGRTTIAGVGDSLDSFKVLAISADDVSISGPSGTQSLCLNFENHHISAPTPVSPASNNHNFARWPGGVAGPMRVPN